jgi:formylglycine-generating enzyme required for sulfatase activity
MGDSLDGETDAPVHTVYVSAFYMDKYDVTYALWQQVYNWATNHGYSFDRVASGKTADHPVQTIDWYDCVKWCNARSEMEGRTPAYYTDATQTTVYRAGALNIKNACVNWNAGYRLPTEAEWEKAARGGLRRKRFRGGTRFHGVRRITMLFHYLLIRMVTLTIWGHGVWL